MSSLVVSIENECDDAAATEKELSKIEAEKKADLKTEVLRGGAEIIETVFDEWTQLCEEGAGNEAFFRPEWFRCFAQSFETKIILLLVRRAGKLRAVLPLAEKKSTLHGLPARKLQAVFNLQTQRFDLIHGPCDEEKKEILDSLWQEIKKMPDWHLLEFRLVPHDSWLNELLLLAGSEGFRTGIWPMDSAPFVTLPEGAQKERLIEKFLNNIKKHLRQDLKRRLKRLQEKGDVEFTVTRGYSPELMRKYFDLEARSWKGKRKTALIFDDRAVRLHQDFACAAAANNALFFYELKFAGETIAISLNIIYGRKTFFWKTSYNEEFRRFSSGNLLIREFLADAIRNGSNELDMLCPAAPYKKAWATGERRHVAFYVFRKGFKGWLFWKWKFAVIRRLRKLKKKAER